MSWLHLHDFKDYKKNFKIDINTQMSIINDFYIDFAKILVDGTKKSIGWSSRQADIPVILKGL